MHSDASQDLQTTGGTFQRGQRAEGRQASRGQLPTDGRTDRPAHTNRRPGTTQMACVCVCVGGEEPPATPLGSENTLHSGARQRRFREARAALKEILEVLPAEARSET